MALRLHEPFDHAGASGGSSPPAAITRAPRLARLLFGVLEHMQHGSLRLTTPDRGVHRFGRGGPVAAGSSSAPAELVLNDWSVIASSLRSGDVGFAEAYMAGRWDTPDLVQLLTVLAANQVALERVFYGRAWVRALLRIRHLLNANTRAQARRNIVSHYDVGNTFYATWLDPSMTYSSALFEEDHGRDLATAQQAKYRRALSALDLREPSQLLEIGCGWGGFAQTAAAAGHEVTGISLSEQQTFYANAMLARAGLADRARCHIRDYRDVRGDYDAIVSIEMIEAVGERYWPHYFDVIARALRPGGRACIQAITIADNRFERYRTQSDFIQQYVFPGGMLPCAAALGRHAASAGLRAVEVLRFGADYAETLRRWLARFDEHQHAIRKLGFDTRFIRCWRFYLAYCAASFSSGTTDVGQYTFAR